MELKSSPLTPIVELGVEEAYEILTETFGVLDLPPLEAIENEDWGRDQLLSRFYRIASDELAKVGLTLQDANDPVNSPSQSSGL